MPQSSGVKKTGYLCWVSAGSVSLAFSLAPTDAHAQSTLAVSTEGAATNKTATTWNKGSVAGADASNSARATAGGGAETVVVTGTHDTSRKAIDSLSPVDVISSAAIARTGATDLRTALATVNPSITFAPQILAQAAYIDSIRMRGLNPDQVLVLVDGKRRHNTADIDGYIGPEAGETPVDIDMIPMSLVDHVEVLRDGAAAQYGSDAIAGVVNIILKSSAKGGSAQEQIGQTEEGDGFNTTLTADQGVALGNSGFIHLGIDFKHQAKSIRNTPDNRTGRLDIEDEGDMDQTREVLGVKGGTDIIGSALQFYGNLTYGHRHGEEPELYRLPTVLPQYYPAGFQPLNVEEENDFGTTLGVKGDDLFGFDWDLSSTFGDDHVNIGQKDTVNLNLYNDYGYSPTTANLMGYDSVQWTNNLDFRRTLHVPFTSMPFQLAFGGEHRYENYRIIPGSFASYYKAGTQALAGLSPQNTGTYYRDIYAAYVDVSMTPVKNLELDAAGRFEHYTDVNNAETGKLAARYQIVPALSVRATVSTGFRAPTLAEQHFSHLQTSPTNSGGQLAVDSPAAQSLGADPLKPEYSTNVSGGFVIRPYSNAWITVDAYQINIRDRIVNGGSFFGETAIQAIEATGIDIPSGIPASAVSATYYTNSASTRTQGIDVSANYSSDFNAYGKVDWSLGLDLNRTRITHLATDGSGQSVLNAQQVSFLTTTSPRSKLIMAAHWTLARFDMNLQETRWGQTTTMDTYENGPLAYSTKHFFQYINDPHWTTNIELGYRIVKRVRVAVGAYNLFDVRPTALPPYGVYDGAQRYDGNSSQIGPDGGYYYAKLQVKF